MRRVMIGLGILGLAQGAAAADLEPYLRGSMTPTYHWSGAYGGAQVGYSNASFNFTNSETALASFISQTYPSLGGVSGPSPFGGGTTNNVTYGGFVGYNAEWEDLITGVEVNYSHSALASHEVDTFDTVTVNGIVVAPAGQTAMKITDVVTVRGRVGWEIWQFLPYAFGGVAIGRADLVRTASTLPMVFPALTSTDSGLFIYGGAAGLGIDIAVLPNMFVRAEWEYALFAPTQGVNANINTVRTALAVRF
jgi:outer membrane immunogenic protein